MTLKSLVMSAAVAAASLVPAAALACDGNSQQAMAEPKSVTPVELAAMTKEKKATPVDANGTKTRTEQGVVPGAILLTSSSQYDLKELPQDKASKLVFYCANSKCGASHAAAAKAMEAGYTNVSVMPEGIVGWKKAGQPTAKPNT